MLVDTHGIVVALDEATERDPPGKCDKSSAAGVGAKRKAAAAGQASQSGSKKCKAAATRTKMGKGRTQESSTCSSRDHSSSPQDVKQSGGPLDLSALPECSLSSYLTSRVRAEGRAGEGITVRVLSHTMTEGRFPSYKKSIFAFRQDSMGTELALIGMYVHEFVGVHTPATADYAGGGSPPMHHQANSVTGRSYIECLDSLPILGSENGELEHEHRQQVLVAIIHG